MRSEVEVEVAAVEVDDASVEVDKASRWLVLSLSLPPPSVSPSPAAPGPLERGEELRGAAAALARVPLVIEVERRHELKERGKKLREENRCLSTKASRRRSEVQISFRSFFFPSTGGRCDSRTKKKVHALSPPPPSSSSSFSLYDQNSSREAFVS